MHAVQGEREAAGPGTAHGGLVSRRAFLAMGIGTLGAAAAAAAGADDVAAAAALRRGPPWAALAASLAGALVRPDDAAYPVAKQLYNERFDGIVPAAIAYCAGPADVQRCVDFARRHGVQVAARSGGHSYGGYSLCPGLVVDVSRMAGVRVAGDRRTATVGAGARMIDLYAALGQTGLLLPGGSCPTIGVAGLALGGGVSVFGRRFGLTCDRMRSVDLVTADGALRTCDRSRNEDLFWASRGGGGGNFGIATSFTFEVAPIPPLTLFTLVWPWAAAGDVLSAWLQWLPGTPDELWANCQLLSAGAAGGTTPLTVKVTGVFCGPAGGAAGVLEPLRAAVGSTPVYEFAGPEQYLPAMLVEAGCQGMSVAACHLPSQNPAGTLSRSAYAAKSAYVVHPLPEAGVAAVTDAVVALDRDVPDVGGGISFDAYGGAINRVRPGATAFVHRDAIAGAQWSCSWSAGAPASLVSSAQAWLSATARGVAPFTAGAYQNYIDPTLADWARAYYGTNLPRLVGIKRKVDPEDFFHFAQSIPLRLPAGGPATPR